MDHRRLVATAAATCRQLRALVHSALADSLFEELNIWTGEEDTPGWHQHLKQHAHRAKAAFVLSGVSTARLHSLVAKSSALTGLHLHRVVGAEELAVLSLALAVSGCRLACVSLKGCVAAPTLPPSVVDVSVDEAENGATLLLHSLAHLCSLRRLSLSLSDPWSTACSARLILFFPRLEALHLSLGLWLQIDLAPLQVLSLRGCEMRIWLQDTSEEDLYVHVEHDTAGLAVQLSAVLRQLLCLPAVFELQLRLVHTELSREQQQTLAGHRGLQCLMLCGAGTRDKGPFPHVRQLVRRPDWTYDQEI